MTNKDASIIIGNIPIEGDDCYTIAEYQEAKARAIQALEQQPTDVKTYLKRRDENYVEYNVEWFLKNWELELEILSGGKIKPTDAVSRSDLMKLYKKWQPRLATNVYEFGQALAALPSVTPQRPKAKWIIHPIDCHLACSKCLTRAPYDCKTNFCPVCGAEMGGADDDAFSY